MGWDLGAALNVQGLANILPQRPNVLGALVPAAEVLARDPKLPLLDPDRIKVGWRIFVENASRISTQPLAAGGGVLREALDSLYKLFGIIRDELKTVGPTPPLVAAGVTIEFDFVSCAQRAFAAVSRRLASEASGMGKPAGTRCEEA